MDVCIVYSIENDSLRKRLTRVLDAHVAEGSHGAIGLEIRRHETIDSAAPDIASIYNASHSASVVLISDQLVDDGEPTSAAREIMDAHQDRPFAAIALTCDGHRVPEIHRTVRANASDDELRGAIQLSLIYLCYVSRPTGPRKKIKVRIRRLRTESDLRAYYALRYRVYQIMGYLESEVERAPTGLEIDACDESALHLGAFDRQPGYEVLAGTARLVISSPDVQQLLRDDTAKHTDNLIRSDSVIRNSIHERLLPLMLPVFQSQELNEELILMMVNELDCGELSRVIVDEPYRGAGLSEKLVEHAIDLARQYNLHKLYLECLPIHVPLYRSLRFDVIPGKRGRVTGVAKTMIPMQLNLRECPLGSPTS
jgi:predicted GNAT family N-acyltransferase